MRRTVVVVLGALLFLHAREVCADEWRVATLAPRGSTWMKILERGAQATEEATEGRVKIKYFPGAIQGDDRDVVRKMRLGSLDGGVLTLNGLAMIDKTIGVLQLPRMFRSVDELDYVRRRMWPYFQKRFEKKGYILCAPGDIGWVYFMSKNKIQTLEGLRNAKVWRWAGDKVSLILFKKTGMKGVPLGVPDVYPSLMSGRIDSCFAPPLAAIALRWVGKIRYVSKIPSTYAIGATLIRKETWDRATPEDQKTVRKINKKLSKKLRKRVRTDDRDAYRAMLRKGVKAVAPPDAMMEEMDELAEQAWTEMADTIYTKGQLELVLKYRAQYREKHDAPK